MKLGGAILGSVLAILAALLFANHFVYDFLGLGYNQVTVLRNENRNLQERISGLISQVKSIESVIIELNAQGNHLRLLVDLPPLDASTAQGGTGGALSKADFPIAPDNVMEILRTVQSMTEKLSSELNVQKHNYEEIQKKYAHNKGFFSALPALKPMEGYYSPTGFGVRMHPVLGIFKTHEGLDIVNDVGTPIYASGAGVIEFSGSSGSGYGTMVVLDHGFGYESFYAHLSRTLVREGQRVKRGDLIGRSGRSGLVSGPHLHYEVRYKGVRQNPVDFFFDDLRPHDYQRIATMTEGARSTH